MSIFKVATVLVYLTSVLTSIVSGNSTPDENSSLTSGLKAIFGSSNPSNESATALQAHRDPVNIISEGGSMIGDPAITSQEATKSSKKSAVEAKDASRPENNLAPTSLSDVTLRPLQIKARKGVEDGKKTVGKKGVSFPPEVATEIIESDEVVSKNVANGAKTSNVTSDLRTETTKPLVTPEGNKTDGVTHLPVLRVPGHRPKPTVTSGEGDDDGEGMPSSFPSSTQTQLGMPKKVDFVIPVVITIMATPILGIAAYILYTRGRDCWDKRHYRRMDFLIDGMYND